MHREQFCRVHSRMFDDFVNQRIYGKLCKTGVFFTNFVQKILISDKYLRSYA
jgi:hypothetical protein